MSKELSETQRGNYGKTALDIIGESKILTDDDLNVIVDLKEELIDNFMHAQVFRTRTEMEVSVLNDMNFPTPDAKFWQCQREQGVHFHELVMLSYEYRKQLVEIKKLKRKMDSEKDELEKELIGIEIEKLTFIARNNEKVAKDRIREVREWHDIKARLIPQMIHSLEDCNEHQLVSYTRRFIYQYLAMGNSGSPGERQNLMSQMDMAIQACISKKCIGPILKDLTPQFRAQIANKYQINAKELMGK
jgi:hypothetical protein